MPSISVYMPDILQQDLSEVAQGLERSFSWVVTRACSEWLTRQHEEGKADARKIEYDTDDWEPEIMERLNAYAEESGLDIGNAMAEIIAKALRLTS